MNTQFDTIFNEKMHQKSWTPAHMVAALADRGKSITVQAVMRWSDGTAMPRSELVPLIADALNCTPNDLLGVYRVEDVV